MVGFSSSNSGVKKHLLLFFICWGNYDNLSSVTHYVSYVRENLKICCNFWHNIRKSWSAFTPMFNNYDLPAFWIIVGVKKIFALYVQIR